MTWGILATNAKVAVEKLIEHAHPLGLIGMLPERLADRCKGQYEVEVRFLGYTLDLDFFAAHRFHTLEAVAAP